MLQQINIRTTEEFCKLVKNVFCKFKSCALLQYIAPHLHGSPWLCIPGTWPEHGFAIGNPPEEFDLCKTWCEI